MNINNKVLKFDTLTNFDEIKVHHYLLSNILKSENNEFKSNLKDIAYDVGLTIKKVRRIVDKLEKLEIIEIERGKGKASNTYKYKEE